MTPVLPSMQSLAAGSRSGLMYENSWKNIDKASVLAPGAKPGIATLIAMGANRSGTRTARIVPRNSGDTKWL